MLPLAGIAFAISGVVLLIACAMVGSRQREIGVRMALGATRARVLAMVLREGGRVALQGGIAGVVLALVATRVMSGMIPGAVLADFAMFAGVLVIVAVAVAAACYIPAWRATRVDPAVILRSE